MANENITTAVQSITWTAQPGGGIKPGEFQEFSISVEGLPDNTTTMDMPGHADLRQRYVVNWNQPTSAGRAGAGAPAAAPGHWPRPAAAAAATVADAIPADHHRGGGSDSTARWLGGIGLMVARSRSASASVRSPEAGARPRQQGRSVGMRR